MLKKNDLISLKIEDMTNLGFGVAKHLGLVVFVSGAVTGEEILAKVIKVTSSYAVCRVEKLISPSPIRVNDRCNIEKCSSCAYKSISYGEECRIKKKSVEEAFKKAGLSNPKIAELVPSPKSCGYRNKAQYPVTRDANRRYVIGYYAPKSHRVCEARYCPLTPRVFGEICDVIAKYAEKHGISTYDEESGSGLLRHIYIRRGEVSGEILVTLVVTENAIPNSDELICSLTEKFPEIVGILLNVNPKRTNIILSENYKTLYGVDYIYDTLSGVKLKIKAGAFYQVNHDSCELLYAKTRELASLEKSDTLLDLYCGIGSIGLSMAKDAGELFGVEVVRDAVDCARENAAQAGIENASFFAASADDTDGLLADVEKRLSRKVKPDVIILDPPRSGCGEKAVRYVASLSPKRIVYISCNPTTLARDVKLFCDMGYSFGELTPFDLFPGTGHVESVVCLTRE